MPTLGEFVDHAKQYGFTRRLVMFESSQLGRVTLIYLWRDAAHFAELPDLRQSDRLTRDVVETLCRQLGIPPEDFGL
jgi:hypothetical protein